MKKLLLITCVALFSCEKPEEVTPKSASIDGHYIADDFCGNKYNFYLEERDGYVTLNSEVTAKRDGNKITYNHGVSKTVVTIISNNEIHVLQTLNDSDIKCEDNAIRQ
jgi:hypothetical protein